MNARGRWLATAAAVLLAAGVTLPAAADARAAMPQCSPTTPALESMARRELVFVNRDGERVAVSARVARDHAQLSAGFQHVCPDTISGTTVLFVFPAPVRTRFHMSNVHGTLDIAFIDADGAVIDVVRMEPYGRHTGAPRPLYGSSGAFQYALEAAPGFFERRGIAPGISRMLVE